MPEQNNFEGDYMQNIERAIEDYIQMERDAAAVAYIRKGRIRSIATMGDGRWRVDTDRHFYIRDSLDEALRAGLEEGK